MDETPPPRPRAILKLKLSGTTPEAPEKPEAGAAPVVKTRVPLFGDRKVVREFTPPPQAESKRPPRRVFAPPPEPPPPAHTWRCKPCGKAFDLDDMLADSDDVRCPNCNARLGLASAFRYEDPETAKIRARFIGKAGR
jgi:hypothetical protein